MKPYTAFLIWESKMNLQEIVCSLELAQKLKEIGIKQESLFHWVEFEKEKKIYRTVWEARELDNVIASAFIVEEIFELLPDVFLKDETIPITGCIDNVIAEREYTISHRYGFKLMPVGFIDTKWYCWAIGHAYDDFGIKVSEASFGEHAMTAADAAAKMLIHLIENKLMESPNAGI